MDSVKVLTVLFRKAGVSDELYLQDRLNKEWFEKTPLHMDFKRIEGCNPSTMPGVTTIYTQGGMSFMVDMPFKKFSELWGEFRRNYDMYNLLTRNN
jgi:hypothetical protein